MTKSKIGKKRVSRLEELLATQMKWLELPQPIREHMFDQLTGRKWRFDFAWIEQKVAAEVEGGIHNRGRHVRAEGYEDDCEKYNLAVLQGWRILRFTADMVYGGRAVALLEAILLGKPLRAIAAPGEEQPEVGCEARF